MKVPIFLSCPTRLNSRQENSLQCIFSELEQLRLEPRTLGRSDYPADSPLREVYVIAKHCSGGLILGFEQFYTESGVAKRGAGEDNERIVDKPVGFATSWNHLEAGILFGLQLPLLIFREERIKDGIFDIGVTDVYIHKMPQADMDQDEAHALREVFLKWDSKVRAHYYSE